MNFPKNCPHCDYLLDDGDIYEHFLKEGKSEEEARIIASQYGWSEENKARFSKIVGVYDRELDRTVYYKCPQCKKIILSMVVRGHPRTDKH